MVCTTLAFAQTELNFTNAGATGQNGPTQTQVNTAYDGTTLDDAVTINTQGIQEWTVPATGTYTFEVYGAQGGRSYLYNTSTWHDGGKGAKSVADFSLTQGDVLKIMVGQQGVEYARNVRGAGGGGGSFVVLSSGTTLLMAAGGGGGAGDYAYNGHGNSGTSGSVGGNSSGNTGGSSGGSNGAGGSNSSYAGGGAGWSADGSSSSYGKGGKKFSNGGQGGNGYSGQGTNGGFGGGGGSYAGAGGGGGYSGGGAGSWSYSGNGGGGGSFIKNTASNTTLTAAENEGHGKVVITYCTGFCFESASVVANNNYVDITFSAGTYSTNGGSGALATSDFSLTFANNGGPASAATISSVKKNNNASEGSASALSGGETVVRMFLNITGSPAGIESLLIKAANGSSIYNSSGTAMNAASAVRATLNDVTGPYITGTTLHDIGLYNDLNKTVKVTFSETAYNTNGGSGSLQTSDFALSISGGAATLSSATPTSISISGNTYTLGVGISGTANGLETLTVSPVANSIYDASGNASATSQNNNTITLMDARLAVKQTLEHDNQYGIYNSMVRVDHDTYLLAYTTNGNLGRMSTFTVDADGDPITEVASIQFSGNSTTNWNSLVQLNESTYALAYYGYDSGKDYNGADITNQTGQWISIFTVPSDGSSITEVAAFRHDTYNHSNPYSSLIKVDDNTVALAYYGYNTGPSGGNSWSSWIKTFTVSGNTISQAGQLRHWTSSGSYFSFTKADANTFVLAWSDNSGDGRVTTFTIPTDGSTITEVAELEYDTDYANYQSIVKLDANTYVVADQTTGSTGQMTTFTIPDDGSTITKVAQITHSSSFGFWNSMIPIDEDKVLLAYSGNSTDGYIKVFEIPEDGSSITETVGYEHSTVDGSHHSLVALDYDTYVLALAGQNTDGFIRTFDYTRAANTVIPRISSVAVAADNATIAVTMNEAVYNATGGSGNLETSDFALSISGGAATLGSTTPTSISKSGNVYTLGMNISGTPTGFEEITVRPVDNSIYDASNNEAVSNQIMNTDYLTDKVGPTIYSTVVGASNRNVVVTFSDPVFNTSSGSGALQASDFSVSVSGGTATGASISSVSVSGSAVTLSLTIAGVANGSETLTVNVAANSVYDNYGNAAGTSQSNNTATLKDGRILVKNGLMHHASQGFDNRIVRMNKDRYLLAYKNHGYLQTFTVSDDGATITEVASLNHATSTVYQQDLLQIDSDTYILAYGGYDAQTGHGQHIKTFKVTPDGTSIVEIGDLVHDTYYQVANQVSLVRIDVDTYAIAYYGYNQPADNSWGGYIKTFTVNEGSITEVAKYKHYTSTVYDNSFIHVAGNTFALAWADNAYDGNITTFTISNDGATITEVASLEHDTNDGLHTSFEQLDSDTYVLAYSGSAADGFIKTFTIAADGATITQVASLEHDEVYGVWNSLVRGNNNTFLLAYMGEEDDGYLKSFTIPNNGASITQVTSIEHDPNHGSYNSMVQIDHDSYVLAMGSSHTLTGTASTGAYIRTIETPTLATATVPRISSVALAADNSTVAVTFDEAVYNTNGGSGALQASDFALSISGGTATLSSATPTSISASGNTYTLGIGSSGSATGKEHLSVTVNANSVYDAQGNAASTTQETSSTELNKVYLNDVAAPVIASTAMAPFNEGVVVTFSETVFANNNTTGTLAVSDFSLALSGGTATLSSSTPTSISGDNGPAITLGITLSGLANGSEVITVSLVANSVYDAYGRVASTSQSNNTTNVIATRLSQVASLEYEYSLGRYASIVHVSGNVYAMAYGGPGDNGFLKTFTINNNGSISTITTDEHDDGNGTYNSMIKINGNIFALSYTGSSNNSYLKTFNISNDGNDIEALGQNIHETTGHWHSLVKADDNTLVLAFAGPGSDGYIKTFTISSDGTDITQVSTLEHNTGTGTSNSLVKMDEDSYVLAYAGHGGDGYIQTFTIPDDGSSITKVATREHNNIYGSWNSLVQVDYNTYALAYRGYESNDEYELLQTFTIPLDGSSITEVSSYKFSSSQNTGYYSSLIKLNSFEYALAYEGVGADGYLKILHISGDGETIAERWSHVYDTDNADWNDLIIVDKNTIALTYAGNGNDGYIKTFDLISGDVTGPAISNTTITYNNSSITVMLNEASFNSNANSGALEASDFTLSISGGAATLTSATPSSISASAGNQYTLGVGFSGTPNGSEVLTVIPSSSSAIFDANGTASSTTQSNNTVNFNEKIIPTITAASMTPNYIETVDGLLHVNNSVTVTMSEEVFAAYADGTASGALVAADFVYSVSGGEATLASTTPSSIMPPAEFISIGTYNGHSYYRSSSATSWYKAKQLCENAGGYLAVITSEGENDFIQENFGRNSHFWIGLTDEATEGTHVWVTGETFSYTNWYSGEPNNDPTQHYAGMYYHTGTWWDDHGSDSYYYLLEMPSTSPTFLNKYTLGVEYNGLPNGYERLSVSPAANSIYDATGNVASTDQSNNIGSFTEEKIREIKFLEHETSFSSYNSIVQVDTNTYAVAYSGNGWDGYLATFTIPTHGRTITEVAQLEHYTSNAKNNSLCKVDADTYLLAYSDASNDGMLKTFTISAAGAITSGVQLEHDVSYNWYNSLIQLDADTYVLAYTGVNDDGYIKTFTVPSNGSSITQVASLEHDEVKGHFSSLVKVDANTVALAYASGTSLQGYIKTFTIPADGSSITQVTSYRHDSIQGKYNSFVQADSDTYVLAYSGSGNDGFIKTFTIPADGSSITQVKKVEHDNVFGQYNSLVKISGGSDSYLLAYGGPDTGGSTAYDGFIKTFSIPVDGSTITETYELEYSTAQGEHNSLVQMDENSFALAESGSSDDGFIITFDVRGSDQVAPSITSVTLANDNATVVVNLDENVFNTANGSGSLEASDFALSITGGVATVSSATPTSISGSGQTYTLGIGLSGTPSGAEVLKVSPVANGIYDGSGNASNTTQSNNTISLNDKLSPTISSVAIANDNSTIAVTMSEAVFNTNGGSGALEKSDFALSVAGGVATLSSATPTTISVSSNTYTLGFTLSGTPNGSEVLTVVPVDDGIYDTVGNEASTTQTNNTVNLIDKAPPTVSSVTATTANGSYNAGDAIAVTVVFSEAVAVTGTPQLTLETGSSDAVVNYTSGTGTTTLTFTYTIASGHNSADLDYASTGALALNGGSIKDAAGNNANLALVQPGATNSLAANKALIVDTVTPTVTSVSSSTDNGSYRTGDVIAITITFSENVFVNSDLFQNDGTGRPRLTLETGSTDQGVNYTSGSGGTTLTWSYTVASGNTSSDLDYHSTSALALNSGTIKDAAGNNAVLTLPTPGETNSLAANKDIVIDQAVPVISSVSLALDNSTIAVTMNEAVFNTVNASGALEASDFALSISGGAATLSSATPTSIAINGNIFTVGIGISGTPNGSETLTVVPVDNGIYDAAGNEASTSQSNNSVTLYDQTIPIVSTVTSTTANGSYKADDAIVITITFTEAVTVTGTPQLTLETGSSDAVINYASGTGTATLTFNYTVATGQNSADLDYTGADALALNSGTIKDSENRNAYLTLPTPGETNSLSANKALLIDTAVPTVASVSSTTANGRYRTDDVIAITVEFSEVVTVTGTPQLTLETGSSDAVVNYVSGSGSSTLLFNYTVATGHTNTDLDYVGTSSLALNGGTIKDALNHVATLTLPTPGATNSLSANKELVIDQLFPNITGVAIAADNSTIAVTFNEGVFNTVNASGALETSDFTYSITGGNATLERAHPTSILAAGNVYTLGVDLSGTPNGSEVLSVSPVDDGIYDGAGNEANTTQSNNTATLNDQLSPSIVSVVVNANNALVAVTMSEAVFSNNNASGAMVAGNFALYLAGGAATLSDSIATSISASGNVYTLGFTVSGTPDGSEVLSVIPINNKIYDSVGNEALRTQSNNTDDLFDEAAPTVISVSSSFTNGNAKIGDQVPITVTLSETVSVTGTPQITLETGTTDAVVNYSSGSGSAVLIFTYTVAAGDTNSDLGYTSSSSLAFNSGTIRDLSGTAAVLTLPTPGQTNSLKANKAIVIDGVVPQVPTGIVADDGNTNVTLTWTANTDGDIASYRVYGDTSASPVISLITVGSTLQSYTHSGLTNRTTYYYRISAIDIAGNESALSSDINVIPKPQKYTVKQDSTGDFVTIQTCVETTSDYDTVLVYPGTYVENLSIDNQNVIIQSFRGSDSTIVNGNNEATCLTIVGNSTVAVSGFSLRNGLGDNGGGIFIEGSGAITLDKLHVFSNLASNDGGGLFISSTNSGSVTVSNSQFYNNECVNKGGGMNIQDDNTVIKGTLIYSNSTQQDAGGIYTSGRLKVLNSTFAANRVPSGRNGAAMMIETGLDSSLLVNNIFYNNDDGIYKSNGKLVAYNNYFSEIDSQLDIILGSNNTFSDLDPFTNSSNKDYSLSNTSNQIGSGRLNTVFYGTNFAVPAIDVIGTVRPTPSGSNPDLGAIENPLASAIPSVVSITSTLSDGTYKLGDVISINITFSEPVSVSGTPQLLLETGSTDAVANFVNGADTTILTFNYTVQEGDTTRDLDYNSINALSLNGGTILDSDSSGADLTLPIKGGASSISGTKALVIDGLSPSVVSVSSLSADSSYSMNSQISIQLNFSEPVLVSGTPQLTLETGYEDATVDYSSGSGSNVLTFIYTVQSSDNAIDLDYHTTNPFNINNGTLVDSAGNNALLTMPEAGSGNSLSDNNDIFVNGSVPTVVSVTSSLSDGFFIAGDTLLLTVNFNESVIATGVPQLRLRTGSNAMASYVSGSNTASLVFRYIISSMDNSNDLDYMSDSSLTFNGGNIVDILGSAGILRLPTPGSSNSLKGSKTFIIDNSAPIFSNISEGAIISAGGSDRDFQNLSDTLFVSWVASDSATSVASYQYAVGISAGGSQITPWTSVGLATADTVVFPSYQPLIEGATYFLSVIATDVAGNISSPSLGDGVLVDLTDPIAGNVFDGTTNDINYTGSDSSLTISWSGFSDTRSSITSYKLLIKDDLDNNILSWTDIGDTNSWTATNLSLNNATTYHISLRAVDGAGNLSPVVITNGIVVDTEIPKTGIILDGSVGDMDWHNSDTTLTFTWHDFDDSLSGISYYEYAVGTNADSTELLDWTNASRGDTIATVSLSFERDSTYFVSIRAIDSVSNMSNTVTTDGFTIDMDAPDIYYVNEGSISNDIDIQNIDSVLSSSWQGIDSSPGSGVSYYEIALGTAREDSNIIDWYTIQDSYSLNMLGDSTELNDGTTYYISIRATDYAGNRSDLFSGDGILIDLTPPLFGTMHDGLEMDIDFTQSTTTLSANWTGFIDTVSSIVNYEVAFTDDTTRFDNIPSWDSVGLSSNYSIDTLSTLLDQETYFFILKATDLAGNVSDVFSSDGVTIDYGIPVSGSVYDGLSGDTDWTSSDSTLELSWSGFIDSVSGIALYEYGVGTTPGATNIISWTENGADTNVVVSNLDLIHDGTYYGSVRATDVVGHVSALATSNGIVVDIFDPTVGVPNDGGLVDLDYQGPSDTLGIFWSGNDTREISFYQYSVGTSPGDTNVITWTDNGSETQVTISDFTLTHESVYYANIRAYDMAGNLSTVESSDGIMADLHPPMIGSVYDGLHEDELYTPSDTNLVANWDGFIDTTSGIERYEYAVGTSSGAIDVTEGWISAGENTSISASLELDEAITYYFSIRAVDQVNNISSVASSNGIITDFTGPSGVWVFDGDSIDIDRQNYVDIYQSHWKQFIEQGSGFLTYEYALYDMDNSQYITSWIPTLDTLCNISDLSLVENINYNVHVRGIDSVYNVGDPLMSDGVLIDLSAPSSPMNLVAWFTSGRIFVEWDHNEEVDLNHYSLYGGTEENPTTLLFTTADSTAEAFMSSYEDGTTYYFRITATDVPGNESAFTSNVMGIPQSALITRANPNPDAPNFLNASDTTITIHFTQPLSDIGNITASSIAYDNMNLNSTYSVEDTAIIIHFTEPYGSLDTINIEISNILDWSNNETEPKQLIYTTYLLADYDNDFQIDVLDLNAFKTALTNQDFAYELGPITGTAPHFIPTPNNVFDLRDVMAFVQMWSWSNSSLPLFTTTMPEIGSRIEIEQIDKSIVVSLPEGSTAGQVFIEYPSSSKKLATKGDITTKDQIYLSSTDVASGKILIEWANSVDNSESEIIIDSYSFDRNDIPITLGYTIYGVDEVVISQGMVNMQIRAIPDKYSLHHNYPNPFNPSTTIMYDIPTAGHTLLLIYDLLGREVVTLVNTDMDAGYYNAKWDGRNQNGQSVGAGMYFYHIQSGPYRKSLKMLLVK